MGFTYSIASPAQGVQCKLSHHSTEVLAEPLLPFDFLLVRTYRGIPIITYDKNAETESVHESRSDFLKYNDQRI